MFLFLKHTTKDVYLAARNMNKLIYEYTKSLPPDERFNLTFQLRRAGVSTVLNIGEGCTRNSPDERRRYFVQARGSVVEVDSGMDIAEDLGYTQGYDLKVLGESIQSCFRQLSGLIKNPGHN